MRFRLKFSQNKQNKNKSRVCILTILSLPLLTCVFSSPTQGLAQNVLPRNQTETKTFVSYYVVPATKPTTNASTQEATIPFAQIIAIPSVKPSIFPSTQITASIASYRPINPADNNSWEFAYAAYSKKAEQYWEDVAQKRKIRNEKRRNGQNITQNDYVLNQPPIYDGPPRPAMPQPIEPAKPSAEIPKIKDFLKAAKSVYGFTPNRPRNEQEFMRAYANAAAKAGLTRNQLVALYAFETGGNGTYDLQAGMLNSTANQQPISTAIGYNQLIATASVSVMHEFGPEIVHELETQAQTVKEPERRHLLYKANVVREMTSRARTVPHKWSAQAQLAKTPAGLGIHAMTLDKDVGPLLQTHKLRTSMHFLYAKGFSRNLSGAELEMLNLTGDGNGYDMISMPKNLRDIVPTANFFLRVGYERNPIAKRNDTVAKLLTATEEKMRRNMQQDGAKAMYYTFQSSQIARN